MLSASESTTEVANRRTPKMVEYQFGSRLMNQSKPANFRENIICRTRTHAAPRLGKFDRSRQYTRLVYARAHDWCLGKSATIGTDCFAGHPQLGVGPRLSSAGRPGARFERHRWRCRRGREHERGGGQPAGPAFTRA